MLQNPNTDLTPMQYERVYPTVDVDPLQVETLIDLQGQLEILDDEEEDTELESEDEYENQDLISDCEYG
ncbi:unnamed protein product [Cochlearia groenlandica]